MEFKGLLIMAKAGDREAKEKLFLMYRPLMLRLSMLEGTFSEDLYQELSLTFLNCIDKYRIDYTDMKSK